MKYKILIGCMLCLFSFIPKGAANLVLNPYTSQEISADSIIERVMTFAPSYESIVSDYRANLYIKGKMNIQKKNFILRYVPSMFRLQKGVREYLLETYSDLHYTAPNIYDQKVKASQGTVRGNRGLPGLLEYFSVNIYSSSLLNDERLLSPLAKNGQKYYKYRIDSVMGDPNNLDYRIRFIPRTKSDQLAGGGIVNGSFLAENLVDELSLVIAPVADGGNGVSSFTQVDFLPSWPPTAFHLKEVQTVVPNVLWVRYTRP